MAALQIFKILTILLVFGSLVIFASAELNQDRLNFSPIQQKFLGQIKHCTHRIFGPFQKEAAHMTTLVEDYQRQIVENTMAIDDIFNEQNPERRSRSVMNGCKFSGCCLANIFFKIDSAENANRVAELLYQMGIETVNTPNYVIFISHLTANQINQSGQGSEAYQEIFLKSLLRLEHATKYFVMTSASEEIHYICLHCIKAKVEVVRPLGQRESLDKEWSMAHSDMLGSQLILPPGLRLDLSDESCRNSSKARNCLIKEVVHRFNFSGAAGLIGSLNLSRVAAMGTGTPFNNLVPKLRLANVPFYRIGYKFVIFLDKDELKPQHLYGVLNAMDGWTWIWMVVTLLASSVISFGVFLRSDALSIVQFFMSIFGTLLGQGAALPAGLPRKSLLVLLLWIFGTIVISNGFSGLLFSLMSKPSTPKYPTDSQTLVDGNFQIVTCSYIWEPDDRLAPSLLGYTIIMYRWLGESMNKTLPYTELVSKLQGRVNFIRLEKFLLDLLKRDAELQTDPDYQWAPGYLNGYYINSTRIQAPDHFALVLIDDSSLISDEVRMVKGLGRKVKMFEAPVSIPPTYVGFFVHRTPMRDKILRTMEYILESGIDLFWQQTEVRKESVKADKVIEEFYEKNAAADARPESDYRIFLDGIFIPVPEPLTLGLLKGVFLFWLTGLCICAGLFLIELLILAATIFTVLNVRVLLG